MCQAMPGAELLAAIPQRNICCAKLDPSFPAVPRAVCWDHSAIPLAFLGKASGTWGWMGFVNPLLHWGGNEAVGI